MVGRGHVGAAQEGAELLPPGGVAAGGGAVVFVDLPGHPLQAGAKYRFGGENLAVGSEHGQPVCQHGAAVQVEPGGDGEPGFHPTAQDCVLRLVVGAEDDPIRAEEQRLIRVPGLPVRDHTVPVRGSAADTDGGSQLGVIQQEFRGVTENVVLGYPDGGEDIGQQRLLQQLPAQMAEAHQQHLPLLLRQRVMLPVHAGAQLVAVEEPKITAQGFGNLGGLADHIRVFRDTHPGELLLRVLPGENHRGTAASPGEKCQQLLRSHIHADAAAVGGGNAVGLPKQAQSLGGFRQNVVRQRQGGGIGVIEDVNGTVSGPADAEFGQTRAGDPADSEGNQGGQRAGGQQQEQHANDPAGPGDREGVSVAHGGHGNQGVPYGIPQTGDGGLRSGGFQRHQRKQQQEIHGDCRCDEKNAAFFHGCSFAARSTLGRASTLRTSMSL